MESQLMRELEDILKTFAATVAMPAFDGLLAHHDDPLDIPALQAAWESHCKAKYGYVFPIEQKPFENELPMWLPLVMAAAGGLEQPCNEC